MCKFLSAIGFKNGDIICEPSIDSHELLIDQYKLNDNGTVLRNWVRLEYYPDSNKDITQIKKYKLHIDDHQLDWINDSMKNKWVRKLNIKLKKIIIADNRVFLPTGLFILNGSITIEDAGYATIENAGSATIKYADSATIKNAGYATIKNAGSATIEDAGSATIKYADSATIKNAGYATIKYAGYATIENAGYATIENAGYATIKYASSATIKNAGSATIEK